VGRPTRRGPEAVQRDAPGTGQRPNATAAPPGFTAIGLDDIATEAGVTRVLLYRHFDSKADVY